MYVILDEYKLKEWFGFMVHGSWFMVYVRVNMMALLSQTDS